MQSDSKPNASTSYATKPWRSCHRGGFYPVARRLPETNVSASLSHRRNDVSGQLISQQTGAKLYADYGNSADTSARGYLSSKDAYGKLMND